MTCALDHALARHPQEDCAKTRLVLSSFTVYEIEVPQDVSSAPFCAWKWLMQLVTAAIRQWGNSAAMYVTQLSLKWKVHLQVDSRMSGIFRSKSMGVLGILPYCWTC